MLGLQLNRVSKRGPWWLYAINIHFTLKATREIVSRIYIFIQTIPLGSATVKGMLRVYIRFGNIYNSMEVLEAVITAKLG